MEVKVRKIENGFIVSAWDLETFFPEADEAIKYAIKTLTDGITL